jgi:hypothetical protein
MGWDEMGGDEDEIKRGEHAATCFASESGVPRFHSQTVRG